MLNHLSLKKYFSFYRLPSWEVGDCVEHVKLLLNPFTEGHTSITVVLKWTVVIYFDSTGNVTFLISLLRLSTANKQ